MRRSRKRTEQGGDLFSSPALQQQLSPGAPFPGERRGSLFDTGVGRHVVAVLKAFSIFRTLRCERHMAF